MGEGQSGINLADISQRMAGLVEGVASSVVGVHSGRHGAASGFVWRQGHVITADEGLSDRGKITVTAGGQSYAAELVGHDPSTDVALLRVNGLTAAALTLKTDAAPKAGELVLSVGRRDQEISARLGIVSLSGGAWKSMRGGHIDRLLRLDMTLDRKGEGGLVVDSHGQVLGMAVRGPRRSVLTIPAATIERVAARLLEKGSVRPGYLGLGLHPVRVRRGSEDGVGLIVLGVASGGPGHAAGIMQGDIVTMWNGEALSGMRDVLRRLGPDTAGQSVELQVIRGGQALSVHCTIAERPQA